MNNWEYDWNISTLQPLQENGQENNMYFEQSNQGYTGDLPRETRYAELCTIIHHYCFMYRYLAEGMEYSFPIQQDPPLYPDTDTDSYTQHIQETSSQHYQYLDDIQYNSTPESVFQNNIKKETINVGIIPHSYADADIFNCRHPRKKKNGFKSAERGTELQPQSAGIRRRKA